MSAHSQRDFGDFPFPAYFCKACDHAVPRGHCCPWRVNPASRLRTGIVYGLVALGVVAFWALVAWAVSLLF